MGKQPGRTRRPLSSDMGTAPATDSSGSMPLGNGDIGLNVWVEGDGDLIFHISKTDAWSGNARLFESRPDSGFA